ncbi:MAG: RNA methyltransferase [Clostridiales bacterium]|nr:RNA methyltransferase [Clostridiales bacterium]
MIISSYDNAKIAEIVKLSQKKYRRLARRYVIEGARLVHDAIEHGAKVLSVYVSESDASEFNFDSQVIVADRVFAKIADTVSTQGVLAVVEMDETEISEPTGNCLVLDGLQDPGNVGTLLRTAAACGFTDVYAVNSVDLYSPKVLRAAMSAHFCVKLHELDDIAKAFSFLKGVDIVCADMGGGNVFEAEFATKNALVLGNEGNGLSDYAKTHASRIVALPMANGFESLNVAVAGSVIMYQIFSKRK